jgi:TetR/AcrR family transcriptional regulator, transcriptional repressor for nem operon
MARTKSFDPEQAVARALDVFWARGYDATSTQDLVDALQINRSSLYGTFGSKHALYVRALEHYAAVGAEHAREVFAGDGPLPVRIRRGLLTLAHDDLADRARGCFATNAALELGAVDDGVRQLVRASLGQVRDVLRAELTRAVELGELPPDADLSGLSAALLATLEGVRVLAKGTGDRRLVERAVDSSVAGILA